MTELIGKPAAVVFDLFNTLVDPELWRLRDPIGLNSGRSPAMKAAWREAGAQMRRTGCSALEALGPHADKFSREDRAVLARRKYLDYQACSLANPPARSLRALRELKAHGVMVGVLSNCDEREVTAWHQSPLCEETDAASFSCATGKEKPHPDAYFEILERLGVTPSAAWFAGDGGSDELAGALHVGFRWVFFIEWIVVRRGSASEDALVRRHKTAHSSLWSPSEVAALASKADRQMV